MTEVKLRQPTRESDLAHQITDYLDLVCSNGRGYYQVCSSAPSYGWEGKYRKGQLDIIGWFDNCDEERFSPIPFVLELKTPRGRVKPEQEVMMQKAKEAGGLVMVVRSLDELMQAFQEAGIDWVKGE